MPHLVVEAEAQDGTDTWDVASDGKGGYTLKNVNTGLYLGGKADPTTMAPTLEGTSEPFVWTIAPFEGDRQFFTLSPKSSNGKTRLSLSILRIVPPPLAWMEAGVRDEPWRLTSV